MQRENSTHTARPLAWSFVSHKEIAAINNEMAKFDTVFAVFSATAALQAAVEGGIDHEKEDYFDRTRFCNHLFRSGHTCASTGGRRAVSTKRQRGRPDSSSNRKPGGQLPSQFGCRARS